MEAVLKAMSLPRKLWNGTSKSLIELGYTRIGIDECAALSPAWLSDAASPDAVMLSHAWRVAGSDPVPRVVVRGTSEAGNSAPVFLARKASQPTTIRTARPSSTTRPFPT